FQVAEDGRRTRPSIEVIFPFGGFAAAGKIPRGALPVEDQSQVVALAIERLGQMLHPVDHPLKRSAGYIEVEATQAFAAIGRKKQKSRRMPDGKYIVSAGVDTGTEIDGLGPV